MQIQRTANVGTSAPPVLYFSSVVGCAYTDPVLAGIEARVHHVSMAASITSLQGKAQFIANGLFQNCVLPDGGERLRRTGSISPGMSLKSTSARKAFQWATAAPGGQKFFSLAACRKAIRILMSMDSVTVPQLPGLPYELWLENQAKVVHHLCQRARRNFSFCSRFRFAAYRQSRSMDWEETQLEVGSCILHSKPMDLWECFVSKVFRDVKPCEK